MYVYVCMNICIYMYIHICMYVYICVYSRVNIDLTRDVDRKARGAEIERRVLFWDAVAKRWP